MALAPDVFWRMGLAEWRAAVAGRFHPHTHERMTRTRLTQLMKEHPDA